ncbi:hypothetical protein ACOHYD_12510 [Desulfobacterota bacterium M19]
MGFSRYYFKEHNFLLTRISGQIAVKDLLEHVITVNKEMTEKINLRQLTDCRSITNLQNLSVKDTTNCAQRETNKPGSSLAIVVPDSPIFFGMARAYAMFAEDHRGEVRIFQNTHDALEWLANNPEEVNILSNFIEST